MKPTLIVANIFFNLWTKEMFERARHGMPHIHDSFQCPAHAEGCDCPDFDTYLCNPYWVANHCPDNLNVMPDDPRARVANA